MGSLVSTLFGGSQSKQSSSSTSGNNAFGYLKGALSPNVAIGNDAFATAGSLLKGGPEGDAAFNNYLTSTGYKTMLDAGSKAITGNAAARGNLNSGATGKALTNYGQNMGQQYFGNYLNQLQQLFTGGQQSANTIAGAGQFSNSKSTGTSSNNKGLIPGLASVAGIFGGI